jgi:DNA-binding transcriptional LysR family regulator
MDLLDKMSTYVRVIEAGSFSAAAKQLRISAAAVSRQIAALETELEVGLLQRSTRRMTVTRAGQRYYESSLRILREVDDAQTTARGTGVAGVLKVSAPVTFGLASVTPHLRTLTRKHPALRLDLKLEDRIIDLVLEGVDVAIRVGAALPETTDVVAHRLFAFQRVLVAAPSYVKRRGEPGSPEALVKHDALSHAIDGSGEVWTLANGERTTRVRLNVACSSNAGHVLRDLAVDGAGIALLPEWFVRDQVDERALRIVLGGWHSESVTVHALHRTMHRGEERVRALIAHLKGAYSSAADAPRARTKR